MTLRTGGASLLAAEQIAAVCHHVALSGAST